MFMCKSVERVASYQAAGGRLLRGLDARHTVAAIDADRHLAVDGGSAHDTVLVAIVIDRIVLGCAVIPDRNIALLPAPAHGVFRGRDVRLEKIEQPLAIVLRDADETLHEVAKHERALAGFGMDAHHGMLGLIDRTSEHLVEMLPVGLAGARLDRVVIGVAVDGPELICEFLQGRWQIEISSRCI